MNLLVSQPRMEDNQQDQPQLNPQDNEPATNIPQLYLLLYIFAAIVTIVFAIISLLKWKHKKPHKPKLRDTPKPVDTQKSPEQRKRDLVDQCMHLAISQQFDKLQVCRSLYINHCRHCWMKIWMNWNLANLKFCLQFQRLQIHNTTKIYYKI